MSVVANFIRPKDLEELNARLAEAWKKVNPIPSSIRVLDMATVPPEILVPEEDAELLDMGQYIHYDPTLPSWSLDQLRAALGYEIDGIPSIDAKAAAEYLGEVLDTESVDGIYFPQAISTPRYEIVPDALKPEIKYLRLVHTFELRYSRPTTPREQY